MNATKRAAKFATRNRQIVNRVAAGEAITDVAVSCGIGALDVTAICCRAGLVFVANPGAYRIGLWMTAEAATAELAARAAVAEQAAELATAATSIAGVPYKRSPTLAQIVEASARCAGVARAQLTGSRQSAEVRLWRSGGMVVAYRRGLWSQRQIGSAFGRDHATVVQQVCRAGVHEHTRWKPRRGLTVDPRIVVHADRIESELLELEGATSIAVVAKNDVPAGAETALPSAAPPVAQPLQQAQTRRAPPQPEPTYGRGVHDPHEVRWFYENDQRFRRGLVAALRSEFAEAQ